MTEPTEPQPAPNKYIRLEMESDGWGKPPVWVAFAYYSVPGGMDMPEWDGSGATPLDAVYALAEKLYKKARPQE